MNKSSCYASFIILVLLAGLDRPTPAVARQGMDIPLGGSQEPTIAVDPNDPMRVAYSSTAQLRVSTDGGATWQPPVLPRVPVTHVRGSDPSVAFDSQGRLFMTYVGLVVDVGTNNTVQNDLFIAQCDPTTGEILSGYPVNLTASAGPPQGADKEWLAIDSSPTSPFRDRIYVAWIDIQGGNDSHVRTSFSTDQGVTWSPTVSLGLEPELGYIVPVHNAVAPNGDAYLAFHAQPEFIPSPDGLSGQVLVSRSTDGGVTYQPPTLAFQPGAADITFNRQTRRGPIPGARFITSGSDQPWILPDPHIPGRLYVVACDDPDNLHGAGDDASVYMVTSTDHGATWSTPTRIDDGPGTSFQLMPVAAIDPVSGVIAVHYYDNRNGQLNVNGSYLLDVFATFSLDRGETFSPGIQINDLPFDPDAAAGCQWDCGRHLTRVWGTSANDVFAVGSNGTILHYDGNGWSAQSGSGAALQGVWGSGPDDVFAVGSSGAIYHYNGTFWSTQASGTSELLYGVWGTAPDDIFAVGAGGTILHYDGNFWSQQASGTTAALTDVWANAPDDVFAVGEDGTILHYDGSWSPQASGTPEVLWDIWGSSGDDVFAVGWSGGIHHYDGVSWSLGLSEPGREFTGLWGASGTDVFAFDWRGGLLHYDGAVWSVVSRAGGCWGLWGSSGTDVFMTGLSGKILHYDGFAAVLQDNPAMPLNPTLRIGEYNGAAVAASPTDTYDIDLLSVWCGNWENPNGVPIAQQTVFDRSYLATLQALGTASDPMTPQTLLLAQNRPNPFTARTSIGFDLPGEERVTLRIYDAHGRPVREILAERLAPGSHSYDWDGRDDRGQALASGIYWYRLEAGERTVTRRLVMVR